MSSTPHDQGLSLIHICYGLRAFLIAQSLNQIDKAYGQNHSILDNCHVRITFATNDERTAKRISEALGTATELRAPVSYTHLSMPMHPTFSCAAAPSRPAAVSPVPSPLLRCRCGAHGSPSWSRPTARHAGRCPPKSVVPA